MRKLLIVATILSLGFMPTQCFAQANSNTASEEGLEYLLFEDIPSVVTASKTTQELNKSTSVMTVITENEIVRSGCRTIYELLKRVPGFFPSVQSTWPLIATRGLTADGNDHVLLLIDGHVQNSIIGQGYQQQDLLPTLEKVKQIEIIRGPGSVLWGSSAVWGIINVITKSATDVGTSKKLSGAYGDADKMKSGNYLYQAADKDYSLLTSFSYWKSDGYSLDGTGGNQSAWDRATAQRVKSNVEFPWGMVSDWPPLDQQQEGYDLYAKMKFGNNQLIARVAESNEIYPWETWSGKGGASMMMRKAYVDYKNSTSFSDSFSLDTTIYGDLLIQERTPDKLFVPYAGVDTVQNQSQEEQAWGFETTANLSLADWNKMIAGFKAVRTKIGPNWDFRFNPYTNRPSSLSLPVIGVGSGYDNDYALYAEDSMHFNQDKTVFFIGARGDKDDFREDKTVFLPRAGIMQDLTDSLTAKYIVNTGYLRPNVVYSKNTAVIVDATRAAGTQAVTVADKSENVISHDVQLFWKKDKNYAAITFFYEKVTDYISWNAQIVPQGYNNMGDAETKGVELEGKGYIGSNLAFYANYSYAKAEMKNSALRGAIADNNDVFLNYPRHLYNVGMDWIITEKNSLNVNLNGWRDMPYIKSIREAAYYGENGKLNGEEYVDISYNSNRIFNSPFDLCLFCFNVFDNTDEIGMIANNGVYYPRGRNLGAKLAVNW